MMKFCRRRTLQNYLVLLILSIGVFVILCGFKALENIDANVVHEQFQEQISSRGSDALQEPGVVQIALATSDHRIPAAVAAMNSIVYNTPRLVHFHVITDDEKTASHLRKWLRHEKLREFRVDVYQLDRERFLPGFKHDRIRFAKLVIPDVLRRIDDGALICIDDDILVQGDIGDLWSMPLPRQYIALVSSMGSCMPHATDNEISGYYGDFVDVAHYAARMRKIDAGKCAPDFSGAYVINMAAWRDFNISQQIGYLVDEHRRYPLFSRWGPNPVLMTALYNQTFPMDGRWHEAKLDDSEKILRETKLFYFGGRFPWVRRSPLSAVWKQYFIPDPTGQFQLPPDLR